MCIVTSYLLSVLYDVKKMFLSSCIKVNAYMKSFMHFCFVFFQVFPPSLSDLPPPMLDLLDLDESFSSESVRLAQLTNKCKFIISHFDIRRETVQVQQLLLSICMSCLERNTGTDDDLEFYVRKCGEILGVTTKLAKDQRDAKHILEHVFFQVVEFKKLNQVRT